MLAAFILASIAIELTPGPNMTWLAILSLAHGRRAGLMAVAGVASGLAIIGVAAALGAAALITSSEIAWQVLRWAGIFYLLYLAYDIWQGTEDGKPAPAKSDMAAFRMGLITNLLNPKAAIFYLTVPPRFIADTHDPLTGLLWLTLVYVVVATVIHAGIVVLAGSARTLLTSTSRIMTVRRIMAVLLAGVAVWLALVTGRPEI